VDPLQISFLIFFLNIYC